MYRIILILALLFNSWCALLVANKTVATIDEMLATSPNPDKKKKIIEKQKIKKNKAKEFYCSKVKDKEKCGNE